MLIVERYGIEKGEVQAAALLAFVGIGYLFPYSALSNPVDYWNLLFPRFNVLFAISSTYMSFNLLMVTLLVLFGGKPSYSFRIVLGFVGQFAVLVVVPSSYFLRMSETQNFYFIIIATAIVATFTALIDSCAIAFSAQYPTRIQEAFQLGLGYSNLIGSVYRILTKAAFPPAKVVLSSLFYFYFGAATILLCIISYFYLLSLPISKHYLSPLDDRSFAYTDAGYDKEMKEWLVDEPHTPKSEYIRVHAWQQQQQQQNLASSSSSSSSSSNNNTYGAVDIDISEEGIIDHTINNNNISISIHSSVHSSSSNDPPSTWMGIDSLKLKVFAKIQQLELSILLVFATTLLLWPSFIAEIKCYSSAYLDQSKWWSVVLLGVYALFDVIGRYLVNYRCGLTVSNVWLPVWLRLLYIPLILCSAKGILFTHDLYSILFASSFGFSNGYLGSMCIVMTNEKVRLHERSAAGQISGLVLIFATVLGSFAALFIKNIVSLN